ncbi:hypothetical protein PS710_01629 [Pseudomonas fluorescens]|uniref:Uncharacterized protein n=1 Tax=Pseudomonas fluorescens TaxID=294 RepID=A0A5E7B878_PSEFL|nr:hypothetical protein PS710_01629 [Pseudomonas fluorescens]
MIKPSPNPPDTDPTSPYKPDSNKLNEAAERALDFHFPSTADIKATPRTPSTLFTIDPQATTETLAVYLVETLASVDVMVHHLVDHLAGGSRNALLGISNSIMLAEITANRMLDQIDKRNYDAIVQPQSSHVVFSLLGSRRCSGSGSNGAADKRGKYCAEDFRARGQTELHIAARLCRTRVA